jgi:putative colanic acid biosynthesis glycosyltransferase
MKKILIINTTLNKGGAARVAYDLFENLDSDYDIHFAYGRGENIYNKKTFYFGNKIERFFHIFLVRFLGIEGFGSYFSTKKLIKYIEEEKFDVINVHNLHGYYLNFFSLIDFFKKNKIPVIYSVHDEWPITWLPAHSLGCSHCKTGNGKCTNTYSYPRNYFSLFQKYMLNKKKGAFSNGLNMRIISPSVWLQNSLKESFLNKFKIEVINHGIDTDIFVPIQNKNQLKEKHKLPLDKKIIIFSASNLRDKSKGIHHIIEVADILKKENYLFVGLGNGKIENFVNIKTTGYIYDKKELAEFYALSDIFCFASDAETFLLSAAEAMSCGIPVAGFDLPVVRELINDKVGVLTKSTATDLAKNIKILLNNENKMIEMSKESRKLITEKYSKKYFFAKYLNVYNL